MENVITSRKNILPHVNKYLEDTHTPEYVKTNLWSIFNSIQKNISVLFKRIIFLNTCKQYMLIDTDLEHGVECVTKELPTIINNKYNSSILRILIDLSLDDRLRFIDILYSDACYDLDELVKTNNILLAKSTQNINNVANDSLLLQINRMAGFRLVDYDY